MDIRIRVVIIYLSVFILTLIATYNLQNNALKYPELFTQEQDDLLWAKLFFWMLIAAGIMLLILKTKYSSILIKLIEFFIVFSSVAMLGFSLSLPLLDKGSLEFGVFTGILASFLRIRGMKRNEIAILSTAGVASMLGYSLSPISSLWLLLILAVYDYIAVFKTGHMKVLARELSKKETTFSVKETQKVVVNGKVREEFMEIGTGDLLVPSLVASSFLKAGVIYFLLTVIGTYFGLILLSRDLVTKKKILPALPYLLSGILLFILLGFVLNTFIFK